MFKREFANCSSESGEKNIDTNFAKLKETILNKLEEKHGFIHAQTIFQKVSRHIFERSCV